MGRWENVYSPLRRINFKLYSRITVEFGEFGANGGVYFTQEKNASLFIQIKYSFYILLYMDANNKQHSGTDSNK